MRPFFFFLFLPLCSTSCGDLSQNGAAAGHLPNILVVMADDQGQWASSVYHNSELNTPNLEALADSGVVFSEAYALSPVCSPSRASFFTGRMPSQHGVHDFLSETPEFDHQWLQNEIFISELLKNAGYRTGLIGKWHATSNSAEPQRGFDYWFSYDVGPEGWSNQYQHQGKVHFSFQGSPMSLDGFQSSHLTDKAIEFINGSSDQPFFLFLGYVDTHAPFEGLPEPLVNKYRSASFSDIPSQERSYLPARNPINTVPSDHFEQLAQYYAAVEWMDQQFGRIVENLKSTEQFDNTLIIYTSDHGHLNGHHGLYGKGNATRPQNFLEETIRVPLIISWPDHVASDRMMQDIPVNNCDLFQTVLQAGGVTLTELQRTSINSPGKDIISYLSHPTVQWTPFKISEMGNARMIADARYKFVKRYPPPVHGFDDELYDLMEDPRELTNVLLNQPEIAARLAGELEMFFGTYSVPAHSGSTTTGKSQ